MGKIIIWCEFQEEVNWEQLNKILKKVNLKINVYVAVEDIKQFKLLKQKIKRQCSNIGEIGAWPILKKDEGYWFSSFVSKEAIDKLDQFKNLNIKIDLEPPIKGQLSNYVASIFFSLFKKATNKDYMRYKILELSKTAKIILSTFPFPELFLRKFGFVKSDNLFYNYMFYSSFFPWHLKLLYGLYYKVFLLNKDKEKTFVALGLIGRGIFGNEHVYKDLTEFRRDIQFLKGIRVKNFAVFELAGILRRKDAEQWFGMLKEAL
ncbi:hypothetical protein HZB88_03945 [archaeon]|nr:hypothetical protein [archaeon]